jgi:hypothetical protein
MARSNEFMQGWAQGWLAATKAMTTALQQVPGAPVIATSPSIAAAASKPARKRGRPKKAAPAKRGRERPRKSEPSGTGA